MPMPIHIRNPDGTPYQIQSAVTPSRKLSPEDLYKAGAITAKEYLSRTGRLQPADGLASALMPRTAAADDAGTLQQLLAGVSDVASLPGRAYASLGRPAGESYQSALARIAASQEEGGADRFSEGALRDPANILAPIGLSALSKIPAVARGLVAAGRYGSLAADVGANTVAQAVANRSIGEDAGVPQSAAMNLAFGLGAHGLSGLARSGMRMISPEERAANFRNWFGDSKVVDEAGKPLNLKHGTYSPKFDVFDVSGESGLHPTAKIGAFFTPDEDIAKGFGNRVEDVYLNASNPYEMSAEDYYDTFSREKEFERLRSLNSTKAREVLETAESGEGGIPDKLIEKRVKSLLREMDSNKNDALLVKAYDPGWDEIPDRALRGNWKELNKDVWVARSPTQIKSAAGNRGTFDPSDPNITHFAGGPTYPQSLASIAASRIVNSGKQAAAMKAQEQ